MEVNVDPAISIKVQSQVQCVEFSPYEWSRGLLAVGLSTSVVIYSVKLKVLLLIKIKCAKLYSNRIALKLCNLFPRLCLCLRLGLVYFRGRKCHPESGM